MLSGLLLATALVAHPVADAPVIRSQADLPRTEFRFSRPPSEAFLEDGFVRDTTPALRSEAERLLRDYRIEDPVIVQRLNLGLAAIALLQHRPADAQRLLAEQRAAESKPQLRRVGFMLPDAMAAGLRPDGSRDCAASAARITELLANVPQDIARDEALLRYGRVQVSSPAYYAGTAVGSMDPAAAQTGSLDIMDSMMLAIWRAESEGTPACREALTSAFRAWLDAPANQPIDFWTPRQPDKSTFAGARPVTIAVWDTGIDIGLFADRLAIDPAEPVDGRDNDGNGVIDDVHGPTFDRRFQPTASALAPLSPELAAQFGFQMAIDKGLLDLNYGFDTPEARMFAARARDASATEQGEDVTFSEELFLRSHGTWVASTLAGGGDWVRIYNLRAIVLESRPDSPPTVLDDIDRWTRAMPSLAARLRGAGVRIVNISWKITADDLTRDLIVSGTERDPEKARVLAKALYLKVATGLQSLIDSCPDILFVTAAGNSNQTDDVMAGMPQGAKAPNILVVGATSVAGRASAFTTFGPSVRIYAQGERVPVLAPGGMALSIEGTSLAAPMVSRTAGGMLAVNPDLKPADLIEGLLASATQGDEGLRLLYPAKAIDWARERP